MRTIIAYNLRQDDSESTAELISSEDIDRLYKTISGLQHTVIVVEVSGKPNDGCDRPTGREWAGFDC